MYLDIFWCVGSLEYLYYIKRLEVIVAWYVVDCAPPESNLSASLNKTVVKNNLHARLSFTFFPLLISHDFQGQWRTAAAKQPKATCHRLSPRGHPPHRRPDLLAVSLGRADIWRGRVEDQAQQVVPSPPFGVSLGRAPLSSAMSAILRRHKLGPTAAPISLPFPRAVPTSSGIMWRSVAGSALAAFRRLPRPGTATTGRVGDSRADTSCFFSSFS
jgi:hypothetical protein